MQFAHVDEFAHGAVGFGGVKRYFTFKAYGTDDQFGELADGELLAGAYVDVAVADLAQAGDVAATAGAVVAVDGSIGAGTIMHGAVFLYANDITEVHIQQHVHGGIGHVLAPEELAERRTITPKDDLVIGNAILGKNTKNLFLFR